MMKFWMVFNLVKVNLKLDKESNKSIKVKISSKDAIVAVDLAKITLDSPKEFVKPDIINKNQIVYKNQTGESIDSFLSNGVRISEYFTIVNQILDATKYLISHGLLIECLIKDTRYIFIENKNQVKMIYVPISHISTSNDMLLFLNVLSNNVVLKNKDDLKVIREFKNYIRSLNVFDIGVLKQKLSELCNRQHTPQNFPPKDIFMDFTDDQTEIMDNDKTELSDDETYIMDNIVNKETHFPKLKRLSTNEIIYISKSVFRIGKDKNCVDYFIDNVAVSRSHADIIVRGTRCFIVDLKSKNKTYINDNVIPINTECELHNDDVIILADEEFVINF